MKANRKFLNRDDEAVSPVIAVILMVAITVVLAATVYVWVSGFGAQSTTPAKSIALTSASAMSATGCGATGQFCKNFTVASATSGMKYQDVKFNIAGTEFVIRSTSGGTECNSASAIVGVTAPGYAACAGTTERASTDLVTGGDQITFVSSSAIGTLSGKQLQVVDASANSVLLTLTIT